MQEKKPETKIGWFEREWDAFWNFFKRRKRLALLMIILLCGYFFFTTAKTFWGIPALNESHKTKIGEIADTRDNAIRERDDAFRDRGKAFRERDDAVRDGINIKLSKPQQTGSSRMRLQKSDWTCCSKKSRE